MAAGPPGYVRRLARRWRLAARRPVYRLLEHFLATDEGRRVLSGLVRGFAPPTPVALPPPPYTTGLASPATTGGPPVFITARFRSGSTLLWQVFRNVRGATAFYEPHNGRRWFDPRHLDTRVDSTHRGVDNYWREYEGMEALGAWHQASWGTKQLYMAPTFRDADMRAYLDYLVAHAPGRPLHGQGGALRLLECECAFR